MNSKQTFRSKRSRRSAFTLVELLLVISIIAILASLGVGVMAQAQNDAAVSATRSRISVIRKILEIELEDYEVRRSPVNFAGVGALIAASSLDNVGNNKTLLHAKILKRMIIADLIRAEMPDGSRPDDELLNISQFPSETLLDYLDQIGISRAAALSVFPIRNYNAGTGNFDSTLPLVRDWQSWSAYGTRDPGDFSILDGIDDEAADKSELLYQILLNIDVDGVPAVDQLGSQAIGDTDGDGAQEVIDAWGEPIFLQWQQEWMTLAPAPATGPDAGKSPISLNIWNESNGIAGLSREHVSMIPDPAPGLYCKPVLPTQIRPFLVSGRLVTLDGVPVDYQLGDDFADDFPN